MADTSSFDGMGKPKTFWKRPEGTTGTLFLAGLVAGAGYILYTSGAAILAAATQGIGIVISLMVLGALIYMVLDPKMRNLVGYMYKSVMRWVTSMFITIDPIGILENYVDDLQDNLKKMSTQIGAIRGQMRKLKNIMEENAKEIDQNLKLAKRAKDQGVQKQMLLSSRKAARLKESNAKYDKLYKKMDILYKVLTKMYTNSEILLEDTKDQVKMKKEERKAIRASHSAMKSAMSVISGDSDKRAMFDQALEVIADDVANKVGEMERFMEMSSSFMDSVDLQNGVFEEEGLTMLAEWEKQSTLMLMDGNDAGGLDLNEERPEKQYRTNSNNDSGYEGLFDS